MPPIDSTQAKTFMELVYIAGPLGALLILLTVCIIALHKYVFRDVLATHVTVSENGKLSAASNATAAAEHRAGSEAARGAAAINMQMLEVLKDSIEAQRARA